MKLSLIVFLFFNSTFAISAELCKSLFLQNQETARKQTKISQPLKDEELIRLIRTSFDGRYDHPNERLNHVFDKQLYTTSGKLDLRRLVYKLMVSIRMLRSHGYFPSREGTDAIIKVSDHWQAEEQLPAEYFQVKVTYLNRDLVKASNELLAKALTIIPFRIKEPRSDEGIAIGNLLEFIEQTSFGEISSPETIILQNKVLAMMLMMLEQNPSITAEQALFKTFIIGMKLSDKKALVKIREISDIGKNIFTSEIFPENKIFIDLKSDRPVLGFYLKQIKTPQVILDRVRLTSEERPDLTLNYNLVADFLSEVNLTVRVNKDVTIENSSGGADMFDHGREYAVSLFGPSDKSIKYYSGLNGKTYAMIPLVSNFIGWKNKYTTMVIEVEIDTETGLYTYSGLVSYRMHWTPVPYLL